MISSLNLSVITYGTEGDTRPLVGLCHALKLRGHKVRLFADRSTLSSARILGVDVVALAGDIRETAMPDGALHALMNDRGTDPQEALRGAARIAQRHSTDWLRTLAENAKESDAILFSGLASYIGLAAGQCLDKPAIGLGLWPISPTSAFPSPLIPPMRLPGWLNRLSHQFINQAMWRMFRPAVNEAMREVFGIPPKRSMWSNYPILYGVSSHLVPQPTDWPTTLKICGAWQAPVMAATAWEPPPALRDFLSSSPTPPVYIGFGSMGGFDRQRMIRILVEGLGERRALFWPGWSGIKHGDLPSNFHVIDAVPHEALFPLVSTVIHHGGAGTTHTAVKAGVPSVVIPFAADQFFWADRLFRLGIAAPATAQNKIDAASFAHQLAFAEQPETRVRAERIGRRMSEENGLEEACNALEKILCMN